MNKKLNVDINPEGTRMVKEYEQLNRRENTSLRGSCMQGGLDAFCLETEGRGRKVWERAV